MPSTSQSIWEIIGNICENIAINFPIYLGNYWEYLGKYQMPSTSQSIWELIGEYLGKYQMPSTSQSIWEIIGECFRTHLGIFGKYQMSSTSQSFWEHIGKTGRFFTHLILPQYMHHIHIHQVNSLQFSQS